MGYVKSRIKELTKDAGSKTLARAEAESWFKETSRSRRMNEAIRTRDRFVPGKIYVFDYDPKTDLEWYDKNPVVLALERVGDNDLGVNLNLIPVDLKERLLDDLYTRFEGQIRNATTGSREFNANAQRPLRITYEGMKNYLNAYGYDFAIRQYIPSRKTRQSVVSYTRWPEMALCDFIDLNGATVQQVRAMFRR
jgi:hypothetical protein